MSSISFNLQYSCALLLASLRPDGHVTYSNGHRTIVSGAGGTDDNDTDGGKEGDKQQKDRSSSSSRTSGNKISEINFIKLRPEPLTEDNIYDLVEVSSMLESPVCSLYHTLHSVYGPMLQQNSSFAESLPTRMHQLLAG